MVQITVIVPQKFLASFDENIKQQGIVTRSEGIRIGMRMVMERKRKI